VQRDMTAVIDLWHSQQQQHLQHLPPHPHNSQCSGSMCVERGVDSKGYLQVVVGVQQQRTAREGGEAGGVHSGFWSGGVVGLQGVGSSSIIQYNHPRD